MGNRSVYHPDILDFISAKEEEGKLTNANMSVVVDDLFMQAVENDETFETAFNGVTYKSYKAKDIFNLIVEGAWRNGEPGVLFYGAMNDSPYRYSNQTIYGTNPCISGDSWIRTTKGKFKIKDLVGKEVDVYCMDDNGNLAISKATNIRKTRENAELVRIATTKGSLVCTPDHLIYTKNRGYIRASELNKTDKIVGLNRRMGNEKYVEVSLTGSKYVKEHRLIAKHYYDIFGKDVHHKDSDTLNNSIDNLEVISHSKHSVLSNIGHKDWNEHNDKGQYLPKPEKAMRDAVKLGEFPVGVNLRIVAVNKFDERQDVYDMEVEKYHNFLAENMIVHNCGEQPLPANGVCNLGSIDISKLLNEEKVLDLAALELVVRLGTRFLNDVVDKSSYPTEDIKQWAEDNKPVGLGKQ